MIGIFNDTTDLMQKYMSRVFQVNQIPPGHYYARFKTGRTVTILLSQYTTSILLDFLTLGTVRERFDTLLIDRPPQNQ